MPCGAQVEDRQPSEPKPHLMVEVQAGIVGTPVRNAAGHPLDDRTVRGPSMNPEHRDETAHGLPLSQACGTRTGTQLRTAPAMTPRRIRAPAAVARRAPAREQPLDRGSCSE